MTTIPNTDVRFSTIRSVLGSSSSSSNNISLKSFYGATYGVPISGTLSFSKFAGKQSAKPSTLTTSSRAFGAFNTTPWALATFPDASAQWIWNTSNAKTAAVLGCNVAFQVPLYNNTNTTQAVKIYASCDDQGSVWLNRSLVGPSNFGYQSNEGATYCNDSASLQAGSNILEFVVSNSSAGAGLIFTVLRASDNAVLARSTSSTSCDSLRLPPTPMIWPAYSSNMTYAYGSGTYTVSGTGGPNSGNWNTNTLVASGGGAWNIYNYYNLAGDGAYTSTSNITSNVDGSNSVPGEYAQLQIPSPMVMTATTLKNGSVKTVKILGSSNGSNWSTLGTLQSIPRSATTTYALLPTASAYTYIRLVVTHAYDLNAAGWQIQLEKWTMYGREP